MSSKFEDGLKNPESWDFDHMETKEPVKAPRVVVSVAFRSKDYKAVAERARRSGKKTSEFIRDAALEKASGRGLHSQVYPTGNSGSLWFNSDFPAITRVDTKVIDQKTEASVLISS